MNQNMVNRFSSSKRTVRAIRFWDVVDTIMAIDAMLGGVIISYKDRNDPVVRIGKCLAHEGDWIVKTANDHVFIVPNVAFENIFKEEEHEPGI